MSEEQTPVEPTEVDTSQPVDILNNEGKFNQSWVESLPEDLGKHSIWQKYDNPIDLVKGSINAQSLAGRKAEEFWTSEDEGDIAKRKEILGIPSDVDGYELSVSEVPEGLELDEERINAFRQLAYENNIPPKAAQAILEFEMQNAIDEFNSGDAQIEAQRVEAEEELRSEWKGDQYDYNIAKVAETMEYLGLGEFKDDPGIGNNTEFIKALFENVVPLIDSDDLIEARQTENYATMTDQLVDLEQRMYNWQGDTNDTVYQQMVRERGKLLEKIS